MRHSEQIQETPSEDGLPQRKTSPLIRLVPIALLAAGLIAFLVFDLGRFVSLEVLRENRATLKDLVAQYSVGAGLAFMMLYALVVAFSLPIASLLTIAGGFLFGLWWGAFWVVLGATLGASAVFSAVRMGLGDLIRERMHGPLQRLEKGFREDAFSYLLVLRLVPLFPFWLVNLAPAILGVSLRTFVLATFIGIIPGSFVYVSIGNGLGALFDQGETPNLDIVLQPEFLIPIVGLGVLAMIPVVYKRWVRRKQGPDNA